MESKTVERLLLKLEAMNNFVDNEEVQTSAVDDDPRSDLPTALEAKMREF